MGKWNRNIVIILFLVILLNSGVGSYQSYAQEIDPTIFLPVEKNEKISSALTKNIQKEKILLSSSAIQESELTRIVIKTSSTSQEYLDQLKNLGVEIEISIDDRLQVSVPLDKIQSIANLDSTIFVREPIYADPDVVSQGVALINADLIHAGGNTGLGIKVGIIDPTGFDVGNAEISGNIVATKSFRMPADISGGIGSSNHGGAVAEIVVDVAPGVDLYLFNFETGMQWEMLVQDIIDNWNLDMVVMSASFFNAGAYDGTSFISLKIDDAKASGILWVNSVGNSALGHWQGPFVDGDFDSFNNFVGADETIEITANQDDLIRISLLWDDPFGASGNDYELLVFDDPPVNVLAFSFNSQTGFQDPVETVSFFAPYTGTYHIVIQNFNALNSVIFEMFTRTQDLDEYNDPVSSIPNAADANGAFAVGAHHYQAIIAETFSSRGPTNDGRISPDIAAPDGVANSVFGTFFGTSAAAPHVGGAAALTLWAFPGSSPDMLQQDLEDNTFLNQAKDNDIGTGLLDVAFLTDSDGDGVPDIADPCPIDNPDDTDGDGVCDSNDICPGFDDAIDTDGDGIPDGCDAFPNDPDNDIDGDGVSGEIDNCPNTPNTGQEDLDKDGIGDACDPFSRLGKHILRQENGRLIWHLLRAN